MEPTGNIGPSFPSGEFDQWAETYDQDVRDDSTFPFEGYARVLDTIVDLAEVEPGMRVLDLGTGTANLAVIFARRNCQLWCLDFSEQMLVRARRKLPQARFIQADLRANWPAELDGPYERIVSAYVFHHFPQDEKINLVARLSRSLVPGGYLLIADIAFRDLNHREATRLALGDAWENEFYWIADQVIPCLEDAGLAASFHPVSSCAGVFVIQCG